MRAYDYVRPVALQKEKKTDAKIVGELLNRKNSIGDEQRDKNR